MNKTEEVSYSAIIPCCLGILFIISALWLLPENCRLFISNVPGPQMCHTIPMPDYCDSYCEDMQGEFVASIIAGIGIGLFFIPAIIYFLVNSRKRSSTFEQYELLKNEERK